MSLMVSMNTASGDGQAVIHALNKEGRSLSRKPATVGDCWFLF